jgi:DNA-binding response OmpR family regulator
VAEKILVVEDELALRETLAYNLEKQGYVVYIAADGKEALHQARTKKPDLMILDIMLPEMDGLEVCRILRQEMTVPILMLTARSDEIDKVVGLEVGADDYLTKPFSMRELLSRIKAIFRRIRMIRDEVQTTPGSETTEKIQFGGLLINLTRREVSLEGNILYLKPKEYELLVYLAEHRGIVLSRDKILKDVWGWDFSGGTRTVDVHMRWLREKIETDSTQPERIVTVRGAGYRFEG